MHIILDNYFLLIILLVFKFIRINTLIVSHIRPSIRFTAKKKAEDEAMVKAAICASLTLKFLWFLKIRFQTPSVHVAILTNTHDTVDPC